MVENELLMSVNQGSISWLTFFAGKSLCHSLNNHKEAESEYYI